MCNKKYLDSISDINEIRTFLEMRQRTDYIKKLQNLKARTLLRNLRELRRCDVSESAVKEAERKFTTNRH